jgi:L-alanine-DL-glutamate epimerase-like enolase superfamily enzyme
LTAETLREHDGLSEAGDRPHNPSGRNLRYWRSTTIGGLSYGVESPEAIVSAINHYLTTLLKGQAADNLNVLTARTNGAVKGNTFAKSAIETELLDAQGKALGLPVSALLGGALTISLHAWSTLPLQWGSEMSGPLLLRDYIVSAPLTFAEGEVTLPQTPGLGTELEADVVSDGGQQPDASLRYAGGAGQCHPVSRQR